MTTDEDQADLAELARAEAEMRADDEMRARNFMPAVGADFGFDSEEARQEYLKEIATWYEAFFSSKGARDVASVRYMPDEPAEVEIRFLDGSALHDEGDRLLLSGPATPEKADLMIEIVLAKGWTEARLRGSKEFKRELARACFEHGIKVLNPEMASSWRTWWLRCLSAQAGIGSTPSPSPRPISIRRSRISAPSHRTRMTTTSMPPWRCRNAAYVPHFCSTCRTYAAHVEQIGRTARRKRNDHHHCGSRR